MRSRAGMYRGRVRQFPNGIPLSFCQHSFVIAPEENTVLAGGLKDTALTETGGFQGVENMNILFGSAGPTAMSACPFVEQPVIPVAACPSVIEKPVADGNFFVQPAQSFG